MRYETLGDYWTDDQGVWHIKVVPTAGFDWALIALHELVEQTLCKQAGIPESAIDTFDMEWTAHLGYLEPGDDPAAPYYHQHAQAMRMEKLFAAFLGIDWSKYEHRCNSYTIPPSLSDPVE